jgi:hypothetical protein
MCSVERSSATAIGGSIDRLDPSSSELFHSRAGSQPVRPLVRRLTALLAHRHRLLTAAQAAVEERERDLELARLELRAAEYARIVLERRLEALLNAPPRDLCPAGRPEVPRARG